MNGPVRCASLISMVALSVLAIACDGDSSPTATSANGRLTVRMTDAPIEAVSSVNVFVTELMVKRSGEPAVRIAGEIGPIDLLTLQGTTMELVSLGVEAGAYEFVQIELDPARSSVVEVATGATLPLAISSSEVKVLSGFTVPEGGETVVTLDFDVEASLQLLGNGDWRLTPVILRVG